MRQSLRTFVAALAALTVLTGPSAAKCGDRAIAQPDLITLLPPPPEPGSDADRADFAALLDVQRARTPDAARRAELDRTLDAFVFSDVLGPDFSEEKLPLTADLLDRLDNHMKGPVNAAKDYWCRPRPFRADAEKSLKPLFESRSPSYPSGHNAFGRLAATVLAQLFPNKRAELFKRGDAYGDARVVAGVHYPADAAAGKLAGTLIAETALRDPAFVFALERAKIEVRQALPHLAEK